MSAQNYKNLNDQYLQLKKLKCKKKKHDSLLYSTDLLLSKCRWLFVLEKGEKDALVSSPDHASEVESCETAAMRLTLAESCCRWFEGNQSPSARPSARIWWQSYL